MNESGEIARGRTRERGWNGHAPPWRSPPSSPGPRRARGVLRTTPWLVTSAPGEWPEGARWHVYRNLPGPSSSSARSADHRLLSTRRLQVCTVVPFCCYRNAALHARVPSHPGPPSPPRSGLFSVDPSRRDHARWPPGARSSGSPRRRPRPRASVPRTSRSAPPSRLSRTRRGRTSRPRRARAARTWRRFARPGARPADAHGSPTPPTSPSTF